MNVLTPRSDMTSVDRSWAALYQPEDVLHYTRGSKEHGIEKGSYATVVSANHKENQITVQKPDGQQATYDPKRLQGIAAYREIDRDFAQGDRIQFTANNRELAVSNRDMGTIERIDANQIRVKMDGAKERTVAFDAAQRRYAVYALDSLRVIFEICGLIAAIIASGSLWLGPWRKRWLEGRFMTERLRQWHFQLLVCKGSEIDSFLNQHTPISLEAFRSSRKIWFDDFLHEYAGKLDSRMDSLTSDPDFASDWLHSRTAYTPNSSALKMISAPYLRLRINHQYDYATHKLSETTDHPFWQFLKWPLLRQDSAIRSAVSFCFVVALLSSVGIIFNRYFDVKPNLDLYLDIAAMVTAILGVAFRTVQEGLGITRDIERYRDYRGKVRRLLLFFENTEDLQQRLQLMQEMELMVVDELRSFLRTHRGANFVL
jgi:hypothetical protein